MTRIFSKTPGAILMQVIKTRLFKNIIVESADNGEDHRNRTAVWVRWFALVLVVKNIEPLG